MVFVELGNKDWDEMIKKEDTGFKIEEDPIKNIKNRYQDSKNATKNSKIAVLRTIRSKIEKMMAMGENSKLIRAQGDENSLIIR